MNRTAKTILEQLGGQRFIAMTGSKDFISTERGLYFSLPRSKTSANRMQITLQENDLYKVDFFRYRSLTIKTVSEHNDVYATDLRRLFTEVTGLYTTL